MAREIAVQLNGLEKAASVLVCMGVERSAQVMAHMSNDEVKLLAEQMARIGRISGDTRRQLLTDFQDRYNRGYYDAAIGGLPFVQRLLSELFGEERASFVMDQLTQSRGGGRPFRSLRVVDASRLLTALVSEHPGVIALVLYYLPRDKAGQILVGLPDAIRQETVMRLVNLQAPVPQVVTRLEQLLAQKLSDLHSAEAVTERESGKLAGTRALVEILGKSHPGVEKSVYQFLLEREPDVANEVRKSMFVFEDITRLDSRSQQLLWREVSVQEAALALKNAPESLRTLVYNHVSSNVAAMITEELELLGPVRTSQVETAQQNVVATVRRLIEEGTITLNAPDSEESLV